MTGWTDTNGLPPIGDGPWLVQFRSGWVSGPFTRAQIRWMDQGTGWCVIAVQRCSDKQETVTRPPEGQGERIAA